MSSIGLKRVVAVAFSAGLLLASVPALASSPSYNVNNQKLNFFALGNGDDEVFAGANLDTAPVRYENVVTISGTTIDALISVVELSNSSYRDPDGVIFPNTLDRLDKTNELSTEEQANELETTFRNSAEIENIEGFAVIDIRFVTGGTSKPIKLRNLALTMADLDNDQFVEFSGLTSYKLSPPLDVQDASDDDENVTLGSQVSVHTGSSTLTTSFTENINLTIPAGSVRFFASENADRYIDGAEDKSADLFVAQVLFSEVTAIRAKFGSYEPGSASLDFLFEPYLNFSAVPPVTVTKATHTVSYDANTGNGSVPNATIGEGSLTVAGSLTAPGITKSGLEFIGWNTRADGLGVEYAPGSPILPVADTILYAVWGEPTPDSTTGEELADTGETSDVLTMTAFLAILAGAALFYLGRRKLA